jgi:hypothetical protein
MALPPSPAGFEPILNSRQAAALLQIHPKTSQSKQDADEGARHHGNRWPIGKTVRKPLRNADESHPAPPLDSILKSWLDEAVIPALVKRCLRELERRREQDASPTAKAS